MDPPNDRKAICTSGGKKFSGTAHQNFTSIQKTQFKASFSFFMARAFTVFEAGLALKTHGSLVKGLMPFFAAVAGFFFNFKFKNPASLKFPFFLILAVATPKRASITPFTTLFLSPLVSATDAIT